MSDRQLQRLVDAAGLEPALRLAGFYGGAHRRLRIPTSANPAHPLAAVLGLEALERLVAKHGGQLLPVPDLMPGIENMRLAGRVVRLNKHGISGADIARTLGISRSRVSEILEEYEK